MRSLMAFFITLLVSLAMAHIALGYLENVVSFESGARVEVEIAQTLSQLKMGLMYRRNLKEYTGMLFIFESEGRHGFWAKNMNFPVDIIWLNSDLKIVDMAREVQPCKKKSSCPIYRPNFSAKYVLEVPGGFTEKNIIESGQGVVYSFGKSI
jgi:uncharacterized membrane protein (UPF0127 family)